MRTKSVVLTSAGISLVWSFLFLGPSLSPLLFAKPSNLLSRSEGQLQNEAIFVDTLERWVRSFGNGNGFLKSVEINFDEDRFVDNFFVSYKQKNSSNKEEEYAVWQYTSEKQGEIGALFKQDYWADKKRMQTMDALELEAHTKDIIEKENRFTESIQALSQEIDFEVEEVQNEKIYDQKNNRVPSSLLSFRIRPKSSVPNTRFKLKYIEVGLKIRLSHYVVWVNLVSRTDNPLFNFVKEQLTGAVYAMERGRIPEFIYPLANAEAGGEVLPHSLIHTLIESLGISDRQP